MTSELAKRQKDYTGIKSKKLARIKSNHPQQTTFSNNETTMGSFNNLLHLKMTKFMTIANGQYLQVIIKPNFLFKHT